MCDFGLIYPAYMIFFQSRGMSLFQCSALIGVWSFFALLLEIPSGALADRFGRKRILLAGMICKSAAFIVWYFAHSFFLFAVGFLLWGIQEVMASGALEALLFDNLKAHGAEDRYEKITGTGHAIHKTSVALAVLSGGFLSGYSFTITLLATSFTFLAGTLPVLSMHEVTYQGISKKSASYLRIIKETLSLVYKKRNVRHLMLLALGYYAVIHVLDEFIQLYLNWQGLLIKTFGVVMVAVFGIQALGNITAARFPSLNKSARRLYLLGCFSALSLFFAAAGRRPAYLIFFCITFFLYAVIEVGVETRLQRDIPSEIRATVLSVFSLVMCTGAVFLSFSFGFITRYIGIQPAFWFFSIVALCTVLGLLLCDRYDPKQPD